MPKLFKTLFVPASFLIVPAVLAYAPLNTSAGAEQPPNSSPVLAQSLTYFVSQGSQISLNGQKILAPWFQQKDTTGTLVTNISDIALWQNFGLELLSTNNPQRQPVRWFSDTILSAEHKENIRYLNLTNFAKSQNWQIQATGNTLFISTPAVRTQAIDTQIQTWGEPQSTVTLPRQINISLTAPTPAQANFIRRVPAPSPTPTENKPLTPPDSPDDPSKPATQTQPQQPSLPRLDEWLISFNSQTDPAIFPQINIPNNQPAPLKLETTPNSTNITILVPAGWRPKLSTSANPYRLTIDIQPAYMVEKDIFWSKDIRWQQKYLPLGSDRFPVVWLEITPSTTLTPILPSPQTQVGTAALTQTAGFWQADAAINGGFFNRNNKMPLGALRRDGVWLSSPILNRGAVAWNNQGRMVMNRLQLQETVITNTGERLPVDFVNSAFVQTGIARYTPEWASDYTPLSNNEIIIAVENNIVTGQLSAGEALKTAIPIPRNGYLLVFRKTTPSGLPAGTQITLESQTNPANFKDYPHILGAGPLLIQNRQVVLDAASEGFSDAFIKQTASRSVIATTNQGKIILAAIHNRAGGAGATLAELAQLMQQLGAVDALNLDGGSSTALYLGGSLIDRPLSTAAPVHNGLGIKAPLNR
ncbi:phosphodiester glycosidase family protein [Ancylothrix sp. C2]|uniref:phosphodiester glycosidase family protein n=1 Tax=Ancylothrix sp. D3o TaxID=2953691 RepID=UPI0021BA4879|nr:phosphodiester glycosidase family protein [Ancylothrix sp. D3o]MCT7950218.1 phosphodiester glycosidase family protein [Ancylothrix sp. D3o]